MPERKGVRRYDDAMTLPLEFVVTGRPATVNRRKTIGTWVKQVEVDAKAAVASNPGIFPWAGPTMVKLFWFPENNLVADVDNGIKPTIDAMKGVVFVDDRAMQRVVAQRLLPNASLRGKAAKALALLAARGHQLGAGTGVRAFATAVKVEAYLQEGGDWW